MAPYFLHSKVPARYNYKLCLGVGNNTAECSTVQHHQLHREISSFSCGPGYILKKANERIDSPYHTTIETDSSIAGCLVDILKIMDFGWPQCVISLDRV